MLREMPWRQFLEWEAYDQVEPIGQKRGDWQAASIVTALYNVAASLTRSRKRWRVKDWLLEFTTEGPSKAVVTPARQTWQEQKSIAMMFAAMANATPAKRKRNGKRN